MPKLAQDAARNTEIRLLRQEHPDWLLREIGMAMCLSRERARQLLKRIGEPTRHVADRPRCARCNGPTRSKKWRWCRPECRRADLYENVACRACGKVFKRLKKEILRDQGHGRNANGFFCSRPCWRHYPKKAATE